MRLVNYTYYQLVNNILPAMEHLLMGDLKDYRILYFVIAIPANGHCYLCVDDDRRND